MTKFQRHQTSACEAKDFDAEAIEVFNECYQYPLNGSDAAYVRHVTYRTIGNGYVNLAFEPWQLAENIISAADLMLKDGVSVYDVDLMIREHIDTISALYDLY